MQRIFRFIAAASLISLLSACGGEGAKDREEDQVDRERPSLGASKDGDEGEDKKEDKKEEKESREDEDREDSD
jgi:hypothetical protein